MERHAAAGILDKYNVEVIGVQVDAIERGEDRIEFKKTMNKLGIEMARSEVHLPTFRVPCMIWPHETAVS